MDVTIFFYQRTVGGIVLSWIKKSKRKRHVVREQQVQLLNETTKIDLPLTWALRLSS